MNGEGGIRPEDETKRSIWFANAYIQDTARMGFFPEPTNRNMTSVFSLPSALGMARYEHVLRTWR